MSQQHSVTRSSRTAENNFVETSQVARKNVLVIGLAVGMFLMIIAFTIYKWVFMGLPQLTELFFEILMTVIIIERAQGRYTYEAGRKGLRFTKQGWIGARQYEVPYRDIMGIYRYKPKLIGVLRFRRTYRLHSALDGRDVWTLAYKGRGWRGKSENRRIYFKPSAALLAWLHEKLPHKVAVPEEQVVVQEIQAEEAKK